MLRLLLMLLVLSAVGFQRAEAATCPLSSWPDRAGFEEGYFEGMLGLAVNQQTGRLIVGDGGNIRVQYFDSRACDNGQPNGCYDGKTDLGLPPSGIAYANDGTAYLALEGSDELTRLDASGTEVGSRVETTYMARLVAFDEIERRVWASSPGSFTIYCYDENLLPIATENITFTQDHPQGLFIRNGFLYVTTDQDHVYKIELAAPPSSRVPLFTTSQGPAHSAWGIVVDVGGDIFIANRDAGVVNHYDESGTSLGNVTLLPGSAPKYLAIDEAGAFLYVGEAGFRIERFGLRRAEGDCLTPVERTTWSAIKTGSWGR